MKNILKINKLLAFSAVIFCLAVFNGASFGQTLYDSFADGDFTTSPAWVGTGTNWQVVADSDAAAGAVGSQTVRLNVPTAVGGTDYLSSQVANFGTSQEWGLFIGRRAQAFTAANQQYFWLYANEADVTSTTVDGYRIAIGDDSGGDEIRLEYIVDGAVNATVITSAGAIPNALTDIGLLVRVTRTNAGVFTLFTSTLPTASGTGAVATDTPDTASTPVNQGTGTNNALPPANNGFLTMAALHTTGANARAAAEFDQIFFTPMVVTASGATISGRVTTSRGRGLKHVVVMLAGGDLDEPIYATTNQFGRYQFEDISVGNSYVLTVFSRRYTFTQSSRVINFNSSFTDADFVSDSFGGRGIRNLQLK